MEQMQTIRVGSTHYNNDNSVNVSLLLSMLLEKM